MASPHSVTNDPLAHQNSRRPRRTVLKSVAFVNLAELERIVHPRQPELSTIRNFLLLQYQTSLSAAIQATPLISALHAAIPDARVSAAASGIALDVLRGNPGLEQLVATPNPLHELLPAANAIRKAKIFGRERHAVLLTTGNEPSRVILAAVLSGSPTRVGFTLVPELASEYLHYDSRISEIANNLRIIEALGHGPALLEQLQANPALLEPSVHLPLTQSLGERHQDDKL
jgi:ADP-heptose:LPS heptosyltransferase